MTPKNRKQMSTPKKHADLRHQPRRRPEALPATVGETLPEATAGIDGGRNPSDADHLLPPSSDFRSPFKIVFRSPFKIVDAGPASIASFNRFLHVLSSSGVQRFLVSISGVDFYMSFAIQDEGELLSRLRKDERQKMRRREGSPPLPSTTIDEANSRLPTSDSVASAERSFSKLKLLKNYLRSSMSQERLNGLALLCIEKDILAKIDLEDIINDFASKKARRSIFL